MNLNAIKARLSAINPVAKSAITDASPAALKLLEHDLPDLIRLAEAAAKLECFDDCEATLGPLCEICIVTRLLL